MCGVDGDRRVFEEKAAFAMVMEARKRVKARKRFITILPGVMTHVKGRRKRKRPNSVAEDVSSGSVTTSKSTRGRMRTPNVRMRDQ